MYLPVCRFSSAFVISGFAEADKGNDDRKHVEYLAQDTADCEIVYVMYDPKRRNGEELDNADGFAVSRPHSERAAALREKKDHGDPPFSLKNKVAAMQEAAKLHEE